MARLQVEGLCFTTRNSSCVWGTPLAEGEAQGPVACNPLAAKRLHREESPYLWHSAGIGIR